MYVNLYCWGYHHLVVTGNQICVDRTWHNITIAVRCPEIIEGLMLWGFNQELERTATWHFYRRHLYTLVLLPWKLSLWTWYTSTMFKGKWTKSLQNELFVASSCCDNFHEPFPRLWYATHTLTFRPLVPTTSRTPTLLPWILTKWSRPDRVQWIRDNGPSEMGC